MTAEVTLLKPVILTVVLVAIAACGSSPAAPTPVVVAPRATVIIDSWGYPDCVNVVGLQCVVAATFRNTGPDCAETVRATLHIHNPAGALMADVQFNVPVTLRANETYFIRTPNFISLSTIANTTLTSDISATPTKC